MKTEEIKKMIEKIVADGSGIVADDAGSGCGGPVFVNCTTLAEMLTDGSFGDAVAVDFCEDDARKAFETLCGYDPDTDWTQIEFNFTDNGYRQIAWVWEA